MSRRISFNLSSSWISQLLSMAESPVLKEAILWLAENWFHRLMMAMMHPLFELSLAFPYAHFLSIILSSILICSPKENTWIWTSNFLWPITTYSCFRVTIHTTTKVSHANNDHPGIDQECQSNINYYYKGPGVNEVVDLTTVQCVVGRIWDRDEWGIIDQSDNVAIQVDFSPSLVALAKL